MDWNHVGMLGRCAGHHGTKQQRLCQLVPSRSARRKGLPRGSSSGMRRSGLACWLLAAALACGDEGGARIVRPATDVPPIPEGCNPLAADSDCLLPYPSDVFRLDDPARPGRKRVTISARATPVTRDELLLDFLGVHPADGFSTLPPILALLPGGVDPGSLLFHTEDVTRSLGSETTTVLLDAATGERVLHFAELDPEADSDARRALIIRPLVRLAHDARYVVALRRLRDRGGNPVPPPAGFRALRDRAPHLPGALAALAARYETDVFAPLERAGFARGELVLAWDFTVRSEADATGDLVTIRDDLRARLDAVPPVITIKSIKRDPAPHIARLIEGTVRVPLYVTSIEPEASLRRDPDGKPVAEGTAEVPFTLLIPPSALGGGGPARLLQFGHGFFGDRSELVTSFVPELADRARLVVFGTDWWGMSMLDIPPILTAISNRAAESLRFADRVAQGIANAIVMARAARGALHEAVRAGGPPLWDTEHVYFYGISQGAILGGTYFALSPDIERAVLGVGGCAFSFMMFRARPFYSFLAVLRSFITSPLDLQKFTALSQTTFDRFDPITFAPHALTRPLHGALPDRRLLFQIGRGDAQVPNISAELYARALGIPQLGPSPRDIPGVPLAEAPADGSGLQYFFFAVDPLPDTFATPADDGNEVHEAVRRLAAGQAQIDRFLRPGGRLEHTCTGICDPE